MPVVPDRLYRCCKSAAGPTGRRTSGAEGGDFEVVVLAEGWIGGGDEGEGVCKCCGGGPGVCAFLPPFFPSFCGVVADWCRPEEPELVSQEEIHAKMDPVEAERLRTVRNIGIAVCIDWYFYVF